MDQKQVQIIDQENKNFVSTILQKKYCYQGEKSLNDIKNRFQKKLNDIKFETIFKQNRNIIDILFDTFIPAGSILYGFGSDKNVSLSNCYYIPINGDSIDTIGQAIAENMKVFSWRGGVGNSFEILRPKGSPVNNAALTSTGSVSFMPLLSNATQTIGQNGRRGASIFTHAVWHPDIIDFIKSKAHPEEVFEKDSLNNVLPKISGANISVKLSEQFMNAYINDTDWNLVFPELKDKNYSNWDGDIENWQGKTKIYKTVKAKEIMHLISQNAWEYAEPGVLFWDNVLSHTPMAVVPEFIPKGVNPCGEQILPNYGSCNLGAIVLFKYVDNPYTPQASFNYEKFIADIYPIVEFMDLVIDVNHHPLDKQSAIDSLGRKIGLGITGLADCLAMLNLNYGSEKSIEITEKIMSIKAFFETAASIELAKAKGICPALKDNPNYLKAFANHNYFKHINGIAKHLNIATIDLPTEIENYGIRNIGLSTIAPTGTTSIIMDNCTSGIEPLFAFEYYRKSKLIEGQIRVIHPILFNYLKENNPKDLDLPKEELLKKYHYIESHALDYKQRIDMQAVCQLYVTDSISSTVNLPKRTTVEDVEKLYVYAYQKGLKGITIYRDGCNLGGILSTDKEQTDKEQATEKKKLTLANKEKSIRYRVKWKNTIKTYITVTKDENDEPLEVFTKVPKEAGLEKDNFNPALFLERQSYWDSLCRLISLLLRHKVPLNEIIKQLDKSSYSMYDLPAILKRTLLDGVKDKVNHKNTLNNAIECPECGQKSYVKENGCAVCLSCGYSKCQ